MADLVNVHQVAPSPTGGDPKTFEFTTGKLAMSWSYPSQLFYRYNANLSWDWSLAPFPSGPGQPPRTTVVYNAWTMNAKSKHPEEAWSFLSFRAGPVAARADAELGWGIPLFKSLDPVYYQRILRDFPNKNIKPGIEATQYSQGWYSPHMQPGWAEAERKHVRPALDEVMIGKRTAADAVKEFKPPVDKLLKEGATKLTG
jgi:ABC-type glycerol-3-phosphate transport system substrate-binding protein